MKKKICLISPKFNGFIGGMETHGYELAKWLEGNNEFELTSILTRKDVQDGVLVENEKNLFSDKVHPILTMDYEADLDNLIQSCGDADIFFFNSTTWVPIIEKLKEKFPNSKIFMRSGGNDLVAGWVGDENDKDNSIENGRKKLAKIINKYVDFLIVNSEYSRKRNLDFVEINEDKMDVVKGGVACSRFKPTESKDHSKIKIVHVSRFVKFKGIENSINAVAEVSKKTDKKIEFILVGDGPEKENLKKIIEEKNISDLVIFTGAVPVDKVHEYYNNSDIFLHLPITHKKVERGGSYEHVETMGRSFCEAGASGIPSICYGVGGVPEIVEDGKTGFVLKEGDLYAAIRRLFLLVENEKIREKMGESSRKKAVNEFDWNILFTKYLEILQKC